MGLVCEPRSRGVVRPKWPALGTFVCSPCRRRGSRSWALGILLWVSIRGLPGSWVSIRGLQGPLLVRCFRSSWAQVQLPTCTRVGP